MEKLLVDVRTREEFISSHVKGSVNMPHYDLEYWEGFLKGRDITLFCNTGHRTALASEKLEALGIPHSVLGQEEIDALQWTERPLVCAVNYVELRPGREEEFRSRALKLCRLTESLEGFLGSKVMRISGMSAVGSALDGDLRDLDKSPVKYILLTYWTSKEAHERSHAHPDFKAMYDSLPETLAANPYEEFYEVLK
jgi:rhodanese-related sulfurtransferase/heme-degrading monooxygenase HmoA